MFYLTPSKTKIVPFQHVANIKNIYKMKNNLKNIEGNISKCMKAKTIYFFCNIFYITQGTSLVAQMIKNLLAMQET